MFDKWRGGDDEKRRSRKWNDQMRKDLERIQAHSRELDAEFERRAQAPETVRSRLVRFEVPGRCGDGSFSPDGRELVISSGFQSPNNMPQGEVSVYSTASGECLRRWPFDAYRVVVVHAQGGEYVHAWHQVGDSLQPGDLTWCDPSGRRQVLDTGPPINPLVATPTGCAGVTADGELFIVTGTEVIKPGAAVPAHGLACEPNSGLLAAVGNGLVLMDRVGKEVARTPEAVAEHVAFVGENRLVTLHAGIATLWRHDDGRLVRAMSTVGPQHVDRLIGLPQHDAVLAPSRRSTRTAMFRITDQSLRMVEPPRAVHGHDTWGSASGNLLAVTNPINGFLPPAPEQVEIFHTETLLWGGQ
jgi:hypothetical protein